MSAPTVIPFTSKQHNMSEPGTAHQYEQQLPERMSPVPLQTPGESPEPAVEEVNSSTTQPSGWLYQTLHIMSIGQLVFMALSARYWVAALQWFTWDENPIESSRLKTWMFEALRVASIHVGVLFFAVSGSLGMWIGTKWSKSRQNPEGFQEQLTRVRRFAIFIATYDLTAASVLLVFALCWAHASPALIGVWLLAHFGLSVMVAHATRKIAVLKLEDSPVPGDLEFVIHSSLLFMSSLAQIVASMVAFWIVASGFHWSHAREGFAAFCYMAGLVAAVVAGSFGADVSAKHIFSNKEELVGKGARAAFLINIVNLFFGGIVAGFLRGWWAVPDTFSIIPFLCYNLVMLGRLDYLALRAAQPDKSTTQGAGVAAYVQQAQTNMPV